MCILCIQFIKHNMKSIGSIIVDFQLMRGPHTLLLMNTFSGEFREDFEYLDNLALINSIHSTLGTCITIRIYNFKFNTFAVRLYEFTLNFTVPLL